MPSFGFAISPPVPPVPTRVRFPLPVDSTTAPKLILIPRCSPPVPLPPVPVRLIFPSAEVTFELSRISIPEFSFPTALLLPLRVIVPAVD